MAKVAVPRERSQLLILPSRQLNAALRKSAERALRLAKAFGKTVPSAPTPRSKDAAASKVPPALISGQSH